MKTTSRGSVPGNLWFLALLLLAMSLGSPARAAEWIQYEPKPGPGMGKHIVFLTGDEEYRSEEGLPMLAKILSQRHGFKCTVLFPIDTDGTINPNVQTNLPGAEAMDTADCIVMLLRFRNWQEDQMKHFVDALNRGVTIIGLRTSTHAFQIPSGPYKDYGYGSRNSFGRRVMGETWVNHWSRHTQEATRGIIEASAKNLPIFRGVEDIFGLTDVYEAYPEGDSTILLRGQALNGMKPTDAPADYKKRRATDKIEQGINDPMMPVAWTRNYKNESGKVNRIFCTTMGAAVDLRSEGLRRLVVNAVYARQGMKVPARADVTYVDDYKPWMYGFGTYRRGIRPEDHALGLVLKEGTNKKPPTP
jgi:hypothetical protein